MFASMKGEDDAVPFSLESRMVDFVEALFGHGSESLLIRSFEQ